MPERGNRRLWTLLGAAMLSALWTGGMPDAEARVALVVGNSAYRHTDPLANPSNDAEDMASQLRRFGFEVIEGRDLTEDGFYDHLRKFSEAVRRAKGGEAALFFYAGHGIQNDESENYLVPVDVALRDKWSMRDMVQLDDVMETMEEFSGLKLVFLDACRDNPLRGKARTMGASGKRGLAPVTVRDGGAAGESSGTVIVYATAPDDTADDGVGRNSPFTGALLAHIGTPGLEIGEMLDRVTGTVIERTRHTGTPQVPWVSRSKIGQFYFVRGSGGLVAGVSGTTSAAAPSSSEARVAYELAEKVHTIKAYEAIRKAFPETVYAQLAEAQITKLAGGDGDVRPDPSSGQKAEAESGQSAEEEARRRRAAVEDNYWEKCEKSDSAVYCEDYLAEFNDGAYARMAKRRLAEIKEAGRRAEAKRRAEEEARRRAEAEANLKEEAADPANLFAAVSAGDIARVKVLLGAGADANAKSIARKHRDARPLHWAAVAGNIGVVNALLAGGADVSATDINGWTPLHSAAWKNYANAINALLTAGADPNAKDNEGTTVLRRAVIEGHAEAIKALLAGGVDGNWVLNRAAKNGDIEYIKALLAGGADVNARDKDGDTPLHFAAWKNQANAIETLLAGGANVNAIDNEGGTPLHWAARYGSAEAIKALLAVGAEVNAANNIGWTPLHWAARARRGSAEAIKALLAGRADVNATNNKGWTPLHLAAWRVSAEAIKALLANGAYVNAIGNKGLTPLLRAASYGAPEPIEALLAGGAYVNATDNEGWTPLHHAAYHSSEAVEAVLAGRPNVNARNEDGQTALQIAGEEGEEAAVRMLRRAGGQM